MVLGRNNLPQGLFLLCGIFHLSAPAASLEAPYHHDSLHCLCLTLPSALVPKVHISLLEYYFADWVGIFGRWLCNQR